MDSTNSDSKGGFGVRVKCSEKMKKGFVKLAKMPDIPTTLRKSLQSSIKNNEVPFSILCEIQEYCKTQKGIYFHELMEDSDIILPKYEPPPRDPELEARIQRLLNEQLNKEYKHMTRNVTLGREFYENSSFGQEIKSVQKMLITIFNFVLTVAGSFAFAYKATEYSMTVPNIPIQLCSGLIVGTMVFFADLYFVMKHEMVEEGTISETVYNKKID